MLKLLANAGLALTLTLGAMPATVATASAQELELRIDPDGLRPVIRDERRDDRRHDRRDRRHGECSERHALSIARDHGLRRAEVSRVTRRTVTVEGRTRRGPARMTFANERGCPIL